MRFICLLLLTVVLAGCVNKREGWSRYDPYDAVTIDQMNGNKVTGKVIEKTVLCLNARRETRLLSAITNQVVVNVTNPVVVAVTNEIVSRSTNFAVTRMTNALPLTEIEPPAENSGNPATTAEAAAREGEATVPPAAGTTNVTLMLATNQSLVVAPNQRTANTQISRNDNSQLTLQRNNLSISLATNKIVTAETNVVVNYTTNYSVRTMANVSILPTNQLAQEYYLYTELLPPPDFTLASGPSLQLLVDSRPYTFTATNSTATFVGRKGFTTTLYPVSPEVLVAIANAHEVKVRVRGVNALIEKKMTAGSRRNFKQYLLKFFSPQKPGRIDEPEQATAHTSSRPTSTGSPAASKKS